MEYLFHAHLRDDVGMGADPDTLCRDLPQHRVKRSARPAVGERIDPDKNPIHAEQLGAHFVHEVIGVDGRLCVDIASRQGIEDADEPARLGLRRLTRLAIATPKQCHFTDFLCHANLSAQDYRRNRPLLSCANQSSGGVPAGCAA